MFYYASKVLTLVFQPSTFLVLMVIAGLLLQAFSSRRKLAVWLMSLGAVSLLVVGISPIGNIMILPLEERFAQAAYSSDDGPVDGIIMLGGFEDGWVSRGRRGVALNEAAERLTEGVRLAVQFPNAKLIFTGGVGGLLGFGTDAAAPIGKLLIDYGISPDRIVLEKKSRNTFQNALFTKALLKPKPGQRYVLVTSAFHMPRSMGVFRQAGFDVVPFPVDYRTHGAIDATRMFERVGSGLERADTAFKEWVGLAAYWLSGRSNALFPGP